MIFVVTISLGTLTFFRGLSSAGLRHSEFLSVAPLVRPGAPTEVIVNAKNGGEQAIATAAGVQVAAVEKTSLPETYLVTIPKGMTAASLVKKIEASGVSKFAEPNHQMQIGADEGSVFSEEDLNFGDSGEGQTDQTDSQSTESNADTTSEGQGSQQAETSQEETADSIEKTKVGPKITNDPLSVNQWGLSLMKMPKAWEVTTGANSLKVAIVDTGIAADHSDLEGTSFTKGANFVADVNSTYDDNGHGTHVAGLIAAVTNNGIGIAGTAWNSTIMPVKVAKRDGLTSNLRVAEGVSYAANNGAKIINVSLFGQEGTRTLYSAIHYAVNNKKCTVIASTGTGAGKTVGYPAAYSEVIGVGAIDQDLQPAFFARKGSALDIVAPGQDVISTVPRNSVLIPENTSGYATLNGTSMSTGYVSGAAALLLSYDQSLIPEQVHKRLASSAMKPKVMGGVSKTTEFGYGIVDAFRALTFDKTGPKLETKPKEKTVSIEVAGTITDDTNDGSVIEFVDLSDSNIANVEYRYSKVGQDTKSLKWETFANDLNALSPAEVNLNIMKPDSMGTGDFLLELRAQDTSRNYSDVIKFKFNIDAAELAAIKAAKDQTGGQVVGGDYVPSSNLLEEINADRARAGLPPLSEGDFKQSDTAGVNVEYGVRILKPGETYTPSSQSTNPFYSSGFGF